VTTENLDFEDTTEAVDLTFPYHSWIKNGTGASPQGDTTAPLTGTKSVVFLTGIERRCPARHLLGRIGHARLRVKFRMPTTVTADQTLMSLFPTGAARPVKAYFKTTKVLRLGDASSGTSSLFSTPALTSGSTYYATLWVQSSSSTTTGNVRMTVDTGDITTPLYDSTLLTGKDCGASSTITFADFGGAANYSSDMEIDDVTLDYPAPTFMPTATAPTGSAGSVVTGLAKFTVNVAGGVAPYSPAITQTSGNTHAATLIDSNISAGSESGGYVTYQVVQDATVNSVYSVTFTGADSGVSAPVSVTVAHLPTASSVPSVRVWNGAALLP
jgi:hypothetical protein